MKKLISATIILFFTFSAHAATIYVDANGTGDYPTIQAAINAVNDGDTVLVADGVYTGDGNRDIDFSGKAITLKSLNGPNNCIIDCNGTEAEPHRGFFFHTGEDANSVLDGLTVTNGYSKYGGGIYCYYSSPTIINCTIRSNSARRGGGIYFEKSSPTIKNSVVTHCRAVQYGGGAYISESHPLISRCTFIGNEVRGYSGGGACLWASNPVFEFCIFKNNNAAREGGGITLWSSNPIIYRCQIVGNSAYDNWSDGGGIKCWTSDPLILDCLISGNYAVNGGGIACGYKSSPRIVGCTITRNTARDYAGGLYSYWSYPEVLNCILYRNQSPVGSEIALSDWNGMGLRPSICTVSYSDIQGGKAAIDVFHSVLTWDNGNIDLDPCFVEPDANNFRLYASSPCINAGDPNYILDPNCPNDLDGNPRVIGGRIDMGAYEFDSRPIAVAGPNQTAYAFIDGFADVTLDGSDSNDPDGDELTYQWVWTIDDTTYDTNTVNPTIELPVGEHIVTLVVNDGVVDSEPDQLTITVIEPLRAKLFCVPRVLNTQSRRRTIVALLAMPEGILRSDINQSVSLVFTPGNVIARRQYVFQWKKHGKPCTWVMAVFNKSDCMPHLSPGQNQVEVTGKLNDGRYFFGTDTIKIITPKPKPYPWLYRYRRRYK